MWSKTVKVVKANSAIAADIRIALGPRSLFILDDIYQGHAPEMQPQVSELAMTGSRIRDAARVLRISPTNVIKELEQPSTADTHQPKRLNIPPRSATSGCGRAS